MVAVPLGALENGVEYERSYELHPRPGHEFRDDKGITGTIQLKLRHRYHWRMFTQPVAPLAAEPPPFSRETVARNLQRAKRLLDSSHAATLAQSVREVLEWQRPAQTLGWWLLCVFLCLYFPLALVPALLPAALLVALSVNFIDHRFFGRGVQVDALQVDPALFYMSRERPRLEPADPNSEHAKLDEVDALDETRGGSEEKQEQHAVAATHAQPHASRGVFDRLSSVRESLRTVQNSLGDVCTNFERFEGLMTWQHPELSRLFALALAAATLALIVLPFRLLLAAGVTFRFFKFLLKRGVAIRELRAARPGLPVDTARVEQRARRNSGSLALNFLSHAPLPLELEIGQVPFQLRKRSRLKAIK
jgi:hypothetical protein